MALYVVLRKHGYGKIIISIFRVTRHTSSNPFEIIRDSVAEFTFFAIIPAVRRSSSAWNNNRDSIFHVFSFRYEIRTSSNVIGVSCSLDINQIKRIHRFIHILDWYLLHNTVRYKDWTKLIVKNKKIYWNNNNFVLFKNV